MGGNNNDALEKIKTKKCMLQFQILPFAGKFSTWIEISKQ